MKIAVVIPAYNEAKRIGAVLDMIPKKIGKHDVEVIVVDDGSKDATKKVAKEAGDYTVLRHKINLGKGAAAKTGCDAGYHKGADIIVLMDADGQHRPEDLPRLLKPIIDATHDFVIGARHIGGSMPFAMKLGNKFLTTTSRLLFDIKTGDSQSGYRVFSRSAYPKIRWMASNYAMETEMLILAGLNKLKTIDVEIPTVYLDGYKGTTPIDGLKIVRTLLNWKFKSSLKRHSYKQCQEELGLIQ